MNIRKDTDMGAWMTQSVKCPTLGFGSGFDLRVVRLSPVLGSVPNVESACHFLSFPLPTLCPSSCMLSLSPFLSQINKKEKRKDAEKSGEMGIFIHCW